MWQEIIYGRSADPFQELSADDKKYQELLTNSIAKGLYADIQRLNRISKFSDGITEDFSKFSETEKAFWFEYASGIPDKLKRLNLFIRPFEGFCRTCLITDSEITTLVQSDLGKYCREMAKSALPASKPGITGDIAHPEQRTFHRLIKDWNRFALELNYLIPVQLKKTGYEIIRHEEAVEINIPMIRKLARAIHSKYLHEIRSQHTKAENDPLNYFFYTPEDFKDQYIADFDELPDEIKNSNIDNAVHIPTKLLSIGYKIRQVKKGFKPITLHLNEDEIETMSIVEHIRWSWDKRLNGWTYGNVKDETKQDTSRTDTL